LEADPTAIFYFLYFCIYFNNTFIIDFLKTVIEKLGSLNREVQDEKTDYLLKMLDSHGLDRLRCQGDPVN